MCLPLKIIGCLFLTAASFGAGCLLSARLFRRRAFLRRLLSFVSLLSTELRYRGGDIFDLESDCAGRSQLPALCVGKPESCFEDAWNAAINAFPATFSLTGEDISLLREIGSQLGKTDLEGQLKHLSLLEIRVRAHLRDAEECMAQKSRIYKTMGFFVGASAAIVLM